MAKNVQVVLVDDIDGTEASQTLVWGYEGKILSIELSEENLDLFHRAVEVFVANSRIDGPMNGSGQTRRSGGSRTKEDLSGIRAWAKENGYSISERGRIPMEIRAAYNEATAGGAAVLEAVEATPDAPKRRRTKKETEAAQ
jgi:hypothetical protein